MTNTNEITKAIELNNGELSDPIKNELTIYEQNGVSALLDINTLANQLEIRAIEILSEIRPISDKANKMKALAESLREKMFDIMVSTETDSIEVGGKTFKIVNNPESTEVTDIGLVPDAYKRYIATFPGSEWDTITFLLGDKIKNVKQEVDKTAVKKAWKDSGGKINVAGTTITRTQKLKID